MWSPSTIDEPGELRSASTTSKGLLQLYKPAITVCAVQTTSRQSVRKTRQGKLQGQMCLHATANSAVYGLTEPGTASGGANSAKPACPFLPLPPRTNGNPAVFRPRNRHTPLEEEIISPLGECSAN